jgi:hypothetical protein
MLGGNERRRQIRRALPGKHWPMAIFAMVCLTPTGRPDAGGLQAALPVKGVIALFPPPWRHVMHPWQAQWRITA